MKYSHRGWFGFCPVYINNPWSGSPSVCPRAKWLMPLMLLNVAIQRMAIAACLLVNPYWSPTWKMRVTGER